MLTHEIKDIGKVYEVSVNTETDNKKRTIWVVVIAECMEKAREKAEIYIKEEMPSCTILGSIVLTSLVLI